MNVMLVIILHHNQIQKRGCTKMEYVCRACEYEYTYRATTENPCPRCGDMDVDEVQE